MPELPDVEAYLTALEPRVLGRPIEQLRAASPFLVRTFDPPLSALAGRRVIGLERLGKRIVWAVEGDLFAVFHLMISGRLRWTPRDRPPGKSALLTVGFPDGWLWLIESSSRKRASLHVLAGRAALAGHDPGGLEVLGSPPEAFAAALRRENHTLKRALTDPRLLSGIGNAFGDEVLHAARLSPVTLTRRLDEAAVARLHAAATATLGDWRDRLCERARARWPEPREVTAFRPEFAVHGKFGQPCGACGTPVQRIRYAENETNYCPTCQTGGRVLADRSLSRLLGADWPRTLDELERLPGLRASR